MKAWRDIPFGRAALIFALLFAAAIGLSVYTGPISSEAPVEVVWLFPLFGLVHLGAVAALIWNKGRMRKEGVFALLLFWISTAAFVYLA